jgi:hypothetical protein
MKSPLNPLQAALYSRLTGALSYTVYDSVPQSEDFPYITLGDDTGVDWSTKTWSGQEVTTTLHVWSRAAGMLETKTIMDELIQALTGSDLTVTGFNPVLLRLDLATTLRDPDGITRHGVVRFRLKIKEV